MKLIQEIDIEWVKLVAMIEASKTKKYIDKQKELIIRLIKEL